MGQHSQDTRLTPPLRGATCLREMANGIPFPNIDPVIVSIPLGPITLTIYWYAMAYIVGVIIGVWIAKRAMRRPAIWPGDTAPMSKSQVDDFMTWLIVGIILGGRLGYVLFYEPAHFLANPGDIIRVWDGGMAFHGGFLGVVLAAWIFSIRNAVPKLQLADTIAMCTPPGLFLGRVANFINAELWGRPTDAPWGVIFPGARAQDCPGVPVGECARHASQLYEAGLEGLLLGVVLLILAFSRGWLKVPGAICGLFLAGYGAARFFVEFFRVADAQFITPDNPLGRILFLGDFGLSMGQLLSVPMIVFGVGLIIFARRRV